MYIVLLDLLSLRETEKLSFISVTPMTTKFGKKVHLQKLSLMRLTNQEGTGNIITLTSRDKLKLLCFHYESMYGQHNWKDDDLSG